MRPIDADALYERAYQLNLDYIVSDVELRTIKSLLDHAPTIEERKKGEWTTHEVACLLAEAMGDECACNVNGNDEWLPFVCEFAETTCPNVVGVACWEQWLVHRKEKTDAEK